MQKEVILSPEELYDLGTRLQARYIDYAYVAAMEDIGQNYPLFERETGAALVKRGILEEDFSGTVTISAEVEGLLRPIFFGELETSIDICTFGKPNTVRVMKFHFHDGAITMVVGQEGKLLLRQIDRLGIEKLVEELLPADYDCAVEEVADVPREGLTRYFAFKCTQVGEHAEVKTYVESNGVLYHERSTGRVETVPRKSFLDEAAALVKGGVTVAYHDANGRITIDELAARLDIQRLTMTIQKLEYVKKTLNNLEARAQEGHGRTASAISEKAAQTRQEADKLIEEMREASEFIRKTVRRYQRIDAELAQAVGAAAQGGGEQ